MKTRFKKWNWRDMPWIIIGVIGLFLAIGWFNSTYHYQFLNVH